MSRPFVHYAPGTRPEAWSALLERPTIAKELSLDNVRRALVVAPHPDDETLGAGGLIASLTAQGVLVTVLSLTRGDRAFGPADPIVGFERRREQCGALRCLGQPQNPVQLVQLGLPEGALGDDPFLVSRLSQPVWEHDICIGPWAGDGHPDHAAAGAALEETCRRAGLAYVAYPIWAWHWGVPDTDTFLERAARFELDACAAQAKAAALECYQSQRRGFAPVLSEEFLDHFRRPYEVFLS